MMDKLWIYGFFTQLFVTERKQMAVIATSCSEMGISMKEKSNLSKNLYEIMVKKGYPHEFADIVTKNLNTDYTAQRMIWYLGHYDFLPMEEVADEMISILSDRNRIMQKKELEKVNEKWNDFLMHGL